ncbi:MAG: tyrosine-type recombinase/integrase [Lewinellaceae bacterium]|nr:tyrosine-type recombinase/integrase [Phaeodactylibacter sp.]MCB9040886.1 tyrosine-type recombinase/integrase [Lewinellaceae bacterium]
MLPVTAESIHAIQDFSGKDVERLTQAVDNVKHKSLLLLIYSAGLRKGEVLNLRVRDLDFSRECLFVKDSKGGKYRYTLFAPKAMAFLKEYMRVYKPRYWLFEGRAGGQYSESSLQSIFERARERSNVNPFFTLHGLRHSFATHLVEQGVGFVTLLPCVMFLLPGYPDTVAWFASFLYFEGLFWASGG